MEATVFYKSWDGQLFKSETECKEYELSHPPTKTYYVEMELSGFISVKVKASNEELAKEMAAESFYPEDVDFEITNFLVLEKDKGS